VASKPQPVPELDLIGPDGPILPPRAQWSRCGAVKCVDSGPWTGTFVCCSRREGHTGGHAVALGDLGAPDFWQENWR